jgi:hypothetical protein
LSSKGSEILLVEGEGEALDEDLVELQSVHHLKGVEVPDDDISLKVSYTNCFS